MEEEKKAEEKRRKKEQLRKEGKLLSKGQKEKKARQQASLERMREQGIEVPNVEDQDAPKKKKVVYGKKKKTQTPTPTASPPPEEKKPEPVVEKKPEPEPVKEPEPEEEDDVLSDWDCADIDDIPVVEELMDEEERTLKKEAEAEKKRLAAEEEKKKELSLKKKQKEKKRLEEEEKKLAEREASMLTNDEVADDTDANMRSPICVIMGHVDTGKTKLLDRIRSTNVQDNEAGGITQQIGATYFPTKILRDQTRSLGNKLKVDVPGLLVIDTPGHESFTNLRSRGSSLCDIAILVVDIMHGLEPQTLESIRLLKDRGTPFIVALNKIDRMYDWRAFPNYPVRDTFAKQKESTMNEYDSRLKKTVLEFAEQGLNAVPYFKNKDFKKNISLVPTSAITGEGIPDLLMLLIQLSQRFMNERLAYLTGLQCTILEVKVIEGLGTTIDVILVNGVLHEGDTIVVCGMNGPIVTQIRGLLTPEPMRELRVKNEYRRNKRVKAAMGIKVIAQGLDSAVAGSSLMVQNQGEDIEDLKEEVMEDLEKMLKVGDTVTNGVCVQASTLGSLEALLEFLRTSKIPVAGINIGPVHKKDVTKAAVQMDYKKEYAVILAFDVPVETAARDYADQHGVKIFTAEIIYHLFDMFTKYMEETREAARAEAAPEAVFPCVLKILPDCIFNKTDPIVLGVNVEEGVLKVSTPLVVGTKDNLFIGRVGSIEHNHKEVAYAKKGDSVAIKIVNQGSHVAYGRHFDHKDLILPRITRTSLDLLKENFRDDIKEHIKLIVRLKKHFDIQ
eukprot:TRINITY_DN4824_c0_g1_i1.p1 TRINITY_DN4824_c0_g1~~TRINITY_DN4824_c0_g1_i1.p1  ORF type:complete len:785 (+),score=297.70 TRINITY_DN4824_c0_g1_i1:280-2634(+)